MILKVNDPTRTSPYACGPFGKDRKGKQPQRRVKGRRGSKRKELKSEPASLLQSREQEGSTGTQERLEKNAAAIITRFGHRTKKLQGTERGGKKGSKKKTSRCWVEGGSKDSAIQPSRSVKIVV